VTPLEVGGGGDAGRQVSANNMKQIMLSFHNYHDTFKWFPAHAIYSKDGKKALLSWRVAILPFIEQNNLYMQFKLDEPWDSEHNKKLIPMMPRTYMAVGMGKKEAKEEGKTYYVVFTGPNTPFDGNKMMMLPQFTDGTSNTGVMFEAKEPVIWTKPDDLVLPKMGDKMPELGGMFKSGMNVGFADGSVQWVRREIDPATLRALITPAGGEELDRNKLAPQKEAEPPPPAKEPAKEPGGNAAARQRSVNNLKEIGLGFLNYESTYKAYASQAITKDGKALLSWRVAILPFIDQADLYKQFKLDEPWDSEHNRKLITKMPRIYAPVANSPKEAGRTYYQVITGPGTLFPSPDAKVKITSITDGTSNTALVFEANEAVIWTKPDDLVLPKEGEKLPVLGGMFKDGMNVLMCDASVQWLRRDLDAVSLRAIITIAGGEVVDWDRLQAENK
jgi:prepilin-type processing-associated H-X9-DG protein